MDAEETCVLRLDRDAEQQAFKCRGARARQIAADLSTEVYAILANTEAPMRPTRSHSGQHLVQGVVHLGSLFRVERVHGAHQNLERIARKRFVLFVSRRLTLRLSALDRCRTKYPPASSALIACEAVPRVVA